MLRLFPIKVQGSKTDQLQSRLMIIAALIIVSYALMLTLAPAVRYNAGSERYQINHWLGVGVWIVGFSFLHKQSSKKLTHRDPFILPVVALLSGIGLMTIWRLYPILGLRQSLWAALSFTLVWLGTQFPEFLTFLRRYKYLWLIFGLILTALTIIMGTNPNGVGDTRWLQVLGLHFQPSEPLKILLIIYLAGYFSDRLSIVHSKFENLLPTFIVTATAVLLLFFQRDLGTATIILLIYLAMLFTTGRNKLVFWITPALMLIAGLVGYFTLDLVRLRFDTWLNPFGDTIGTSYQIIQSMIAIAEGGLIGTGPGLGSPNLVPVSVSDFIFAGIAEELGLLGITIIILLIIMLLYRGIRAAIRSQNSFNRYLTLGVVFYFGIQSILIIGGNIGLLPLTGVTLPFLSYGGSSLVISFFALLILLITSNRTQAAAEIKLNNQRRVAIISAVMISVLFLEIIASSLISFWFMPSLVSRTENPRWIIEDRFRPRGDILDRNNQALISNKGEIGAFQRISNHIPLYPIVGYTNATYGNTGIEASMSPYLRGYEGYPFFTSFQQNILYNQPPDGLDIRLTIDLNLQRSLDTNLEGTSGSAILINANTGEILAMASHPYFDAASLEAEWEGLVTDEDGPLVNRATQGLYPPGASLLPFVVSSQISLIQEYPSPDELFPNLQVGLECAQPHDEEFTWPAMLMNGCKGIQRELAKRTGASDLLALYESLGFFTTPLLRLTVAPADPEVIIENSALVEGETPFNISPLQMALAISAFTNEGILPGPRIVNAYRDPNGDWITLPKLSSNTPVVDPATVSQVTNLLKKPNSPLWQVISIAKTEEADTITWFVGGTSAEWQGQPLAVVVVIESDSPDLAEMIGNSILDQAIRFEGNATP